MPTTETRTATCEVCGNSFDRPLYIRVGSDDEPVHVFDSFECAVHALAPRCAHCGCRVIGHGVQVEQSVYCCASCARHTRGENVPVADRAP